MMQKREMCEELLTLQKLLHEKHIEYEVNIRESEEFFIDQVKFTYNGLEYSAINGFGTYGGYDLYTGTNRGLLELMRRDEENVRGFLTAEAVMNMIDRI